MRKKIGPKIKLSANPARTVFHDEVYPFKATL